MSFGGDGPTVIGDSRNVSYDYGTDDKSSGS